MKHASRRTLLTALALACASVAMPCTAGEPAIPGSGPVFKTLHVLRNEEGNSPSELMQASDGNLYGVAWYGGAHGCGTFYRMNHDHGVEVLHDFCAFAGDGLTPKGKIVQASDGNFYGTTNDGGAAAGGTVFRYTIDGTYTVLHSFVPGSEGIELVAGLIQATNGKLYGVTRNGGSKDLGTVFSMSLDGSDVVMLHEFEGADGCLPVSPLLEAMDGLLYGTASCGSYDGTVFSISTDGAFRLVHGFTYAEGTAAFAPLMQRKSGQFYGTMNSGGPNGGGTAFQMTPNGRIVILHAFPESEADGFNPTSALLDPGDGNLYGTTHDGPFGVGCDANPLHCGTVYRISPDGTETIVHAFPGGDKPGIKPYAGLILVDHRGLVGTAFPNSQDGGTIFGLWEKH